MDSFERPPGKPEKVQVKCPTCNGSGVKDGKNCSPCSGTGKIKVG